MYSDPIDFSSRSRALPSNSLTFLFSSAHSLFLCTFPSPLHISFSLYSVLSFWKPNHGERQTEDILLANTNLHAYTYSYMCIYLFVLAFFRVTFLFLFILSLILLSFCPFAVFLRFSPFLIIFLFLLYLSTHFVVRSHSFLTSRCAKLFGLLKNSFRRVLSLSPRPPYSVPWSNSWWWRWAGNVLSISTFIIFLTQK